MPSVTDDEARLMAARIVVIGASAGGIEALQSVLGGLPADFDAAVLVVVHMAPGSGRALANILDRAGPLPAVHATDGEPLVPGRVYVCVADHHLLVGRGHVHVRPGPRENGHRPAVDPLFRSAAHYYGPGAVAVVLSGSLSDGTAGLQAVRSRGGTAIVQDPADAQYPGMPTNALEYVGADSVATAAEIGPLLVAAIAAGGALQPPPEPVDDELSKEVALMEHDDRVVENAHPGRPSQWPCPDCDGVLWQIDDGNVVRFRCRVGHAWTADDLLHAQGGSIETALWMALRVLEDRVALSRELAARAIEGNRQISANRFLSDVDDYEESVRVIRQLLNRTIPAGEG